MQPGKKSAFHHSNSAEGRNIGGMLPMEKLGPIQLLVLRQLLEPEFPGRDELISQVPDCQMRVTDGNGDCDLFPKLGQAALTTSFVPVEGSAVDTDGVHIRALLHVRRGKLWWLEIMRDDSELINDSSQLKRLEVRVDDSHDVTTEPAERDSGRPTGAIQRNGVWDSKRMSLRNAVAFWTIALLIGVPIICSGGAVSGEYSFREAMSLLTWPFFWTGVACWIVTGIVLLTILDVIDK